MNYVYPGAALIENEGNIRIICIKQSLFANININFHHSITAGDKIWCLYFQSSILLIQILKNHNFMQVK